MVALTKRSQAFVATMVFTVSTSMQTTTTPAAQEPPPRVVSPPEAPQAASAQEAAGEKYQREYLRLRMLYDHALRQNLPAAAIRKYEQDLEEARRKFDEYRRIEQEERAKQLASSPTEEELSAAILRAVREGGGVDEDGHWLIACFLFESPQESGKLRTSVEKSIQELANQTKQLAAMQEELCGVCEDIVKRLLAKNDTGHNHLAEVLKSSDELVRAELDAAVKHDVRVDIRRRYLERMRTLEEQTKEDSSIVHLRCRAARLRAEIALHREMYTGTLPRKLTAYLELVQSAQLMYRRILAKYLNGIPGGEAEKEAAAAVALATARARLERARGHHQKALTYQRVACVKGQRYVDAVGAAFDAGTVTLGLVKQAESLRLEIRLALFDLERCYGNPDSMNIP